MKTYLVLLITVAGCSPVSTNSPAIQDLSVPTENRDLTGVTLDLTGQAPPDLISRPKCVPENGLRLCFSFEEPITTPYQDGSGNNNHAASHALIVPGKFGNGAGFNGTMISVPYSDTLEPKATATIEFWIQGTFDTSNGTPQEILYRTSATSKGSMEVSVITGKVYASWTNKTTSAGGVTIPLNSNWHYVAFVNSGGDITSYLDGISTRFTGGGGFYDTFNEKLYIGGDSNNNLKFKGNIDELRWWVTARTEQQVCQDGGGIWQGVDNCKLP